MSLKFYLYERQRRTRCLQFSLPIRRNNQHLLQPRLIWWRRKAHRFIPVMRRSQQQQPYMRRSTSLLSTQLIVKDTRLWPGPPHRSRIDCHREWAAQALSLQRPLISRLRFQVGAASCRLHRMSAWRSLLLHRRFKLHLIPNQWQQLGRRWPDSCCYRALYRASCCPNRSAATDPWNLSRQEISLRPHRALRLHPASAPTTSARPTAPQRMWAQRWLCRNRIHFWTASSRKSLLRSEARWSGTNRLKW